MQTPEFFFPSWSLSTRTCYKLGPTSSMTLWVSFHEGRASRRRLIHTCTERLSCCSERMSSHPFGEMTEETTACNRNMQRLSQQEGSEAKLIDEQQRPEVLEMFSALGHLCSCVTTSAPRASSAGMSSPANPTRLPSPLPQPQNAACGHPLPSCCLRITRLCRGHLQPRGALNSRRCCVTCSESNWFHGKIVSKMPKVQLVC